MGLIKSIIIGSYSFLYLSRHSSTLGLTTVRSRKRKVLSRKRKLGLKLFYLRYTCFRPYRTFVSWVRSKLHNHHVKILYPLGSWWSTKKIKQNKNRLISKQLHICLLHDLACVCVRSTQGSTCSTQRREKKGFSVHTQVALNCVEIFQDQFVEEKLVLQKRCHFFHRKTQCYIHT